jgi:hypothetical protein
VAADDVRPPEFHWPVALALAKLAALAVAERNIAICFC